MPEENQDEFPYLKNLKYDAPIEDMVAYLVEEVLFLKAKVSGLQTFALKYAYAASSKDLKLLQKELGDLNVHQAHKAYSEFFNRFGH